MNDLNYWEECISQSAESCDLKLTSEQIKTLADDMSRAHETYSQAYYDPGWNDNIQQIENKYKKKEQNLKKEFDNYINNAETAVKRILKINKDDNISICEHGEIEILK